MSEENIKDLDAGAEGGSEGGSEGAPKKKSGLGFKVLIVVLILFGVLAIAGGSVYLIFHNNPKFCNAICHTPMDPYVASYLDGTSVNAKQASLSANLGVTIHKNEQFEGADITCLTCHNDGITEQMREGLAWVTGNYELPLEMHLGAIEGSGDKYGVEFCLRAGCHVDDAGNPIEDVKALQAVMAEDQTDGGVNPHAMTVPGEIDSRQHEKYYVEGGLLDCSNCHQTHEQSVMICTECHADGLDAEARIAAVPEGWLTFAEAVKLNASK